MRKAVVVLGAIAMLALLPTASGAAGGNIETELLILDAVEGSDSLVIVGQILGPGKCQKFRPMELISDGDVVDEGASSKRGAWAFQIEDKSEANNLKVKALKSKAGDATCSAESESVNLR